MICIYFLDKNICLALPTKEKRNVKCVCDMNTCCDSCERISDLQLYKGFLPMLHNGDGETKQPYLANKMKLGYIMCPNGGGVLPTHAICRLTITKWARTKIM
jgi:hypothetical protein